MLGPALDRLVRDCPLVDAGEGGAYRPVGAGPRLLLVLPGVVGAGDALAALGFALAHDYRTCFVTYPRVRDLDGLLRWIEAVRGREGHDRVSVYGGSFGGLVAQAWLSRAPAHIADLVLSGVGPPDPRRAEKNTRLLPWLRRLPMPAWRVLLRLAVRGATTRAPERARWRSYYGEAIAPLTWQDIDARYRISIDLDSLGPPSAEALAVWRGRMLVLEGERDRIAHGAAREALRRTYPAARFHVVAGAGHGLAFEQPEEWLRVVTEFLRPPAGV